MLVGATFQQQDFGITASSKQVTSLNNVKVDGIGESADNLAAANYKSTLKQNSLNTIKHPPRQPIALFTAPADSPVAKMSQQQVIKDMHAAGRFEVGLQRIMPGLLMLELWNLQAGIELFNANTDNRVIRHGASLGSATIDTLLTLEQVLGLINQKNILTRSLAPRLIPTGADWLQANTRAGSLLNRVAVRMVGRVSASYALGVVSGVITVGVYLADMANDIDQGDTYAAIANGIAAFCAAGSTGALIAGGLGIGMAIPVFWVLLVIGGIAAGIAVWLDDDDIELLLINCPLGVTPNKARYGHLHQSNEAYYRLTSYLTQPQMELKQLSDQDLRQLQPLLTEQGLLPAATSSVLTQSAMPNRQISVNTQFPSWFSLNDFRVRARLIKETRHQSNKTGEFYLAKAEEVANFVPFYQPTTQGLNILLHKPSGGIQKAGLLGAVISVQYRLQLKLQLIARKAKDQAWAFPAPDVEDRSQFAAIDHNPDFNEDEQNFWLHKEWV